MSRRIAGRWKITGVLKAHGPLHVGGMGGNEEVDLMIARDGQNRDYVPGTSLAGPLRAWLAHRCEEEVVDDLFGPPMEKGESDKGHASFILVEDGLVELPKGAAIETRDGVGIDRLTGAAADGAKYDRAVLPNGSKIGFALTVDIRKETDRETTEGIIGALLQALAGGEIRFGAAKSRGLGLVKLESVTVREQNLNTAGGILRALRRKDEKVDLPVAKLKPRPRLDITINWRPRGPLMVKAERDGVGVDMLPLTSAIEGRLSFVLPGSSIKGALRTQAERIVRTVIPGIESKAKFLNQVAVPMVDELFGSAAKSGDDEDDSTENNGVRGGLSALTVEDCYAKPRFTREQWAKIESANAEIEKAGETESELYKTLREAGLKQTQMAMHVAVDRWTGGAADGFLYSVLEPHGVAWSEIRLGLDLGRLAEEKQWPAIACLLFVLRDLAAGRIPFGFGVNRGMGAVAIENLAISAMETGDESLKMLESIGVADGKLTGLSDDLKKKLNPAWQNWKTREEETWQRGKEQ
jgi:CRISPR/Cas system CSM-associated protein Csm3 (group 7 of RAMP superfamily)